MAYGLDCFLYGFTSIISHGFLTNYFLAAYDQTSYIQLYAFLARAIISYGLTNSAPNQKNVQNLVPVETVARFAL